MSNDLKLDVLDKLNYNDSFQSCKRTYVTFCMYSEYHSCADMESLLGIEPTRISKKNVNRKIMKNGFFLSSKNSIESKDLARHISYIIKQIFPKEDRLHQLQNSNCEMRVMCFWESETGNGGPILDPAIMWFLSRLRLELDFDIWF